MAENPLVAQEMNSDMANMASHEEDRHHGILNSNGNQWFIRLRVVYGGKFIYLFITYILYYFCIILETKMKILTQSRKFQRSYQGNCLPVVLVRNYLCQNLRGVYDKKRQAFYPSTLSSHNKFGTDNNDITLIGKYNIGTGTFTSVFQEPTEH